MFHRPQKTQRQLCSFLSILVAALLFGCGKAGDAEMPLGEVSPPKPEMERTVVGVVAPALTSIFHVDFVKGAVEKGKEYGWQVETLAADRETNFTAQVSLVETLVTRRVNAIVLCAINDKAIVGAVEKANEAGIPVFVYASLQDLPGGEVAAYLGFNQREAGKLCGEYTVQKLTQKNGEAKGEVYILEGIPGYHSKERTDGYFSVLQQYPNIAVAGQTPANWERQLGMNAASAALKAHPGIDLIFACSDAMAQGAAQAVIEAETDVMTIGVDGNPDTLKDIQQGVVTASCAVFPEEMGRRMMEAVEAHLKGATTETRIETPIKMIDASNVDQYLGAYP